jgi:hypothetical protein
MCPGHVRRRKSCQVPTCTEQYNENIFVCFLGKTDLFAEKITPQINARATDEERLSRIIESATDAIVALDHEGRITLFKRSTDHLIAHAVRDAR